MALRLLYLIVFILGFSPISNSQVQYVQNWTEYATFDGVRVDYKFETCSQGYNKNKELVVFRLVNTQSNPKTINWTPKWYRGGECVNCHTLDSHEFAFSAELAGNQTMEVDICQEKDKRFFIFSKWITIYPGMDDMELTDFEFINVTVTDD